MSKDTVYDEIIQPELCSNDSSTEVTYTNDSKPLLEYWKFIPDENGKPTYKMYSEDKSIIEKIHQFSGVKPGATYSVGYHNVIGWDVIVPGDRLRAIIKVLSLKRPEIEFL